MIMDMNRVGEQWHSDTFALFQFMDNDMLFGSVRLRSFGIVNLVLIGIVEDYLPRRIAIGYLLLRLVVKIGPILVIDGFPVGKLLYFVVVFGT